MKYQAVVLKSIDYGDTSKIAYLFVQSIGFLTFMCKGIKNKRSKNKLICLEPLQIIQFEMDYRKDREMQYIKEMELENKTTVFHPAKLSQRFFLAEIVHSLVINENNDLAIEKYIFASIQSFFLGEYNPNYHLTFIKNIIPFIGYSPSKETFDPKMISFWNNEYLPSNQAEREEVLNHLLDYLIEVVPRFKSPNSVEILKLL